MKKYLFAIILATTLGFKGFAATPDEGMWLPMLIQRLNYVDMQNGTSPDC